MIMQNFCACMKCIELYTRSSLNYYVLELVGVFYFIYFAELILCLAGKYVVWLCDFGSSHK